MVLLHLGLMAGTGSESRKSCLDMSYMMYIYMYFMRVCMGCLDSVVACVLYAGANTIIVIVLFGIVLYGISLVS